MRSMPQPGQGPHCLSHQRCDILWRVPITRDLRLATCLWRQTQQARMICHIMKW
jgi:hypothetical protein